jgi:hypothetical protein
MDRSRTEENREAIMALSKNVAKFIDSNQIIYMLVIRTDDFSAESFGDRSGLPYSGLADSLFGDKASAQNTLNAIDGKIVPQSWRQGDLKCLCFPLDEGTFAGLFYLDTAEMAESHFRGKRLYTDLLSLWNSQLTE